MSSRTDRSYSISVGLKAPIDILARRHLQLTFPSPPSLLRALVPGEQPDGTMWSEWLAVWGWAWAIAPTACEPVHPLAGLWLNRGGWPRSFDARVLALSVALQLRVDGKALHPGKNEAELERIWRAVSAIERVTLGEVLAMALLNGDENIFLFASVSPQWPADVQRVLMERRSLQDDREPGPLWLNSGYALFGEEGFATLRAMGTSLTECEEVWTAFASGRGEIPWAYELAFWWEATYCLTERHAYGAAELAEERVKVLAGRLEEITGLVDPLWHHQRGRLHFYAGNHEDALAEYLREYRVHGEDLSMGSMLNRELANVLSDLACLESARVFSERSIDLARRQGQKNELYKSLGRLAEIEWKTGNISVAEACLQESLDIQQKLGDDQRAPAQTLTYLGHVAVLRGDPDAAAGLYDKAQARDEGQSSLPYIVMGRFAVAVATGNSVELDRLWQSYRVFIEKWQTHQTHVLPAAVCILAATSRIEEAGKRLPGVARALVANRYAIEAAYLVPSLPEEDRGILMREIIDILNRWHRALTSLPPELKGIAGKLDGPSRFIEALRQKRLSTMPELLGACYPMTLASNWG